MKKCSWWRGHCYHKIDGTERKIKKHNRKECALEDNYIIDGFWGRHIEIAVDAKCCWCDKPKVMSMLDFDLPRAMQYPDYEEKK